VGSGPGGPAVLATLTPASARPAGFEPEESLFEWDDRSCQGLRLLCEYFAFPEKFMFFDLTGLDAAPLRRLDCSMRIRFLLSRFPPGERRHRLRQALAPDMFRLRCVPAVNLFPHPGTPIPFTHRLPSYPVTPAGRSPATCEVYSVDAVRLTAQGASGPSTRPVPALHAAGGWAEPQELRWHASRSPGSGAIELTLVDPGFQSRRPERESLSLQLTCTDRNLPASLPFGGGGTVQEPYALPGQPLWLVAQVLRKPTPSLDPPDSPGLRWRLVSHLALSHPAQAPWGTEALQELLELYRWADAPALDRQIQGIRELRTAPGTLRIPGRACPCAIPGTRLTLTLDEGCYAGSSLFLFATVLERFFGHRCGPNQFVQMEMATLQREGTVARWPPRNGAATWT
jgi:type VI secretion system protein ImpG